MKKRIKEMTDDEWKDDAIRRDMVGTTKKLGKRYDVNMVLWYKAKSLGEDNRLKIQMSGRMYSILVHYGVDFENFTHGIKMFEESRDEFMDKAKRAGWKVEIVDKSDMGNQIFGKSEVVKNE